MARLKASFKRLEELKSVDDHPRSSDTLTNRFLKHPNTTLLWRERLTEIKQIIADKFAAVLNPLGDGDLLFDERRNTAFEHCRVSRYHVLIVNFHIVRLRMYCQIKKKIWKEKMLINFNILTMIPE